MTAQEIQVVKRLRRFNSLTCKQAQDEMSIGRLSAVVGRLRERAGYDAIVTEYISGKNKYGTAVVYGVYHIGDADLFGKLEEEINAMEN